MVNDILKMLKVEPFAIDYINNDLWLLYNDISNNNRYRIIVHNDDNMYNVYIQYIYTNDDDCIDIVSYICDTKNAVAKLIDAMMLYYMINDL